MDKQNNKSTNQQSKSQFTDKKSIFIGSIVVLLIAISPFLFYLYESFPASQTWETSYFKIDTSFPSWSHFAWFLSGKFIPFYLLLLWFFTCKHWWHWIILVPIAMYAFQIWGLFNQSNSVDELEIYYILPLMMVIIPLVYLIRAKLFNKLRGTDLKAFEEELMTNKTFWQQLTDLFR